MIAGSTDLCVRGENYCKLIRRLDLRRCLSGVITSANQIDLKTEKGGVVKGHSKKTDNRKPREKETKG